MSCPPNYKHISRNFYYVAKIKTFSNIILLIFVLILSNNVHARRTTRDDCYNEDGSAKECNPGFEGIAEKKTVTVSETCGVKSRNVICRLVEENDVLKRVCEPCDRRGRNAHPARYLTDIHDNGNLTYWQSKPFQPVFGKGRGKGVNLTISFGHKYEVAYVFLDFNSPRPGAMIIYKSMNFGRTWEPFQYFARDCPQRFNMPNKSNATIDQEVLCSEKFSSPRPLTGGMVIFNPASGRPSENNLAGSFILQNWVTATDIRISLLEVNSVESEQYYPPKPKKHTRRSGVKTLEDHGVSTKLVKIDPAGQRRFSEGVETHPSDVEISPIHYRHGSSSYYAINDIGIGGTCKCNGHASTCAIKGGKLMCNCRHNTDGADCQKCKPFYSDKPWKRATQENVNECQACNCNQHTNKCRFDPDIFNKSGRSSGGVCQQCRHHTTGRFCHFCKDGYYKKNKTNGLTAKKSCKPCGCHVVGSAGKFCNPTTGQCPCKDGVTGKKCNRCAKGYQQTRSNVAPCIPYPHLKPKTVPSLTCPAPATTCKKSDFSLNVDINKFCTLDYVVEARIESITSTGKWAWIRLHVIRSYKNTKERLGRKTIKIKVRSRHLACMCPRLRETRKYLLLGKFSHGQISIDKKMSVLPWRRRYRRRLRRLRRIKRQTRKKSC